jgi:hypothetical protein
MMRSDEEVIGFPHPLLLLLLLFAYAFIARYHNRYTLDLLVLENKNHSIEI